jgi:sugar fermentation stimulation protein A
MGSEMTALMLFLIPNETARVFILNVHTDPQFSHQALAAEKVRLRAFSFPLRDPVTVNPSRFKELPVALDFARRLARDRGSYLLVLRNSAPRTVVIGSLGAVRFRPGYYLYAGSAMNGLQARIGRHRRPSKKIRWHIDYLTSGPMSVIRAYPIRSTDRGELELVTALARLYPEQVRGFGASDSPASSHLFYASAPPHREPAFQQLLLDRRVASALRGD